MVYVILEWNSSFCVFSSLRAHMKGQEIHSSLYSFLNDWYLSFCCLCESNIKSVWPPITDLKSPSHSWKCVVLSVYMMVIEGVGAGWIGGTPTHTDRSARTWVTKHEKSIRKIWMLTLIRFNLSHWKKSVHEQRNKKAMQMCGKNRCKDRCQFKGKDESLGESWCAASSEISAAYMY